LSLDPKQVVEKVDNEAVQLVKCTVNLQPDTLYCVIPCTYDPGHDGKYQLTFSSPTPLTISELPAGEEWKYVSQKGEWKAKSAAGCLNHASFPNNPQFVLKSETLTNATILLTQQHHEGAEGDTVGFYIFETKSVKSKLSSAQLSPKEIKASAEFVRAAEATCEFQLQPKKIYAIIPCTYDPGFENAFELTVFSDHEVKLHELKGAAGGSAVSKKDEKGAVASTASPSSDSSSSSSISTIESPPETGQGN